MNTRDEVIAFCMTMPGAYEDYPFHDANWTAMRFRENRKSFALVYERAGLIWINVKCSPEWMEVWRAAFPSVIPAYHMNKRHWNSIVLDGSIDDADVRTMIAESYRLVTERKQKR